MKSLAPFHREFKQIGHDVINFRIRITPPAPFDDRSRDVEGGHVETLPREQFGVIAESATYYQRAPAFASRIVFIQPAYEMRVGNQIGPGDALCGAVRFGVERLKPAFGVVKFEKGLCKFSCS